MRFKTNKIWTSACAVVITAACANLFSSCNDDLPAESYYTFTGEMMSDFLRNHEDFSLFCQIAERAGQMDFLGKPRWAHLLPRHQFGRGGIHAGAWLRLGG